MRNTEMRSTDKQSNTEAYLQLIGVRELLPLTCPFDPGYDPVTVESHLDQSAHLMETLKISMACWMIADEAATRRKIAAARAHNVPTVTGGGPFEVAVAQGQLEAYLDLCADIGVSRVECGEGFTTLSVQPRTIVRMARERGLAVQYEMGKKHEGPFTQESLREAIARGRQWLDAGAVQLVVEARESARGVGAFGNDGALNVNFADRIAGEFGFDVTLFEAPNKPSQFAMLDHFGPGVRLCNVRLEELLRVEIYRRGLHSDAFANEKLRPCTPTIEHAAEIRSSTWDGR
jgi:phosphosulfolactate synthase